LYTDVNLLGENINAKNNGTETLLVITKLMGVEINAEKTKHMFMLRDT
jgi:hypothetical protein